MGFLDKVKEQAEKAKGQAQDLKGKVGDKVEEVQGKRKVDDLLDDLGRFLYAEHTGRSLPGADTEVARIVAQLATLEADGATVLPGATSPPTTPPFTPPATPAPSAGAPPEAETAATPTGAPMTSATDSAASPPPDLPL